MTLRPGSAGLTALLALLTALGPLSTDLYLPSLPSIGLALETTPARVQLTLSAFLAGFAISQIVYGSLSDRYGRRPVLLGSLALYCVATLGCALAPSIEGLIAFRFLQAVGGSGPVVLARAVVRDLYEGARAARELARMATIMGVVPALAPIGGGVLETAFGWRSSFAAALVCGLLLLAAVTAGLPETLRQRSPEPVSVPAILRGFGHLLRVPAYRVYVGLSTLSYSGLFAWISASSFVLQDVYGLSALGFALAFSAVVIGFVGGSIAAQRLVERRGPVRTVALGIGCLAGGGALMAVFLAAGFDHPVAIVGPMALYTFGIGLTMPTSMALAMAPFPDRAGAASSFLGFVQMSTAALLGAGVGAALGHSAWPMVAAIAATGGAAAALLLLSGRIRNAV